MFLYVYIYSEKVAFDLWLWTIIVKICETQSRLRRSVWHNFSLKLYTYDLWPQWQCNLYILYYLAHPLYPLVGCKSSHFFFCFFFVLSYIKQSLLTLRSGLRSARLPLWGSFLLSWIFTLSFSRRSAWHKIVPVTWVVSIPKVSLLIKMPFHLGNRCFDYCFSHNRLQWQPFTSFSCGLW